MRMRRVIALAWLLSSTMHAGQRVGRERARFCSQEEGRWVVRDYPPLIDTVAGTEVLEFVLSESEVPSLDHGMPKKGALPGGGGGMAKGSGVASVESGLQVSHVYLKSYTSRYELLYDYRFGEDGRLNALHGLLQRWGRWVAEADLFPEEDGSLPELRVSYRLRQGGGVVQAPEDGARQTEIFRRVKVYRTAEEIPCARLVLAGGR